MVAGDARLAERRPRHRARRRSPASRLCGGGAPAGRPRRVRSRRARQLAERRQHRRTRGVTTPRMRSGSTTPGPPTWTRAGRRTWRPTGPAPSRPAGARGARRHRVMVGGEALVAQQRVEGGDDAVEATRRPDVGSASTGQPVAASERLDDVRAVATPRHAGEDHAAFAVESPRQRVRRRSTAAGDRAGCRRPGRARRRELAGRADQRLAERQVEMHRPGCERCGAERPRPGTPGKERHVAAVGVGGRRGRGTSARDRRRGGSGRSSAERRRRAAPAAGRRSRTSIGTRRQAGLDDRRVEVGRRGAARAQQHRRRRRRGRARARRTPATRSSWTTCTVDVRLRRKGERHRRAPRAGRDDGVVARRGATHSSTSVAQNVACTSAGFHRPTIRVLSPHPTL